MIRALFTPLLFALSLARAGEHEEHEREEHEREHEEHEREHEEHEGGADVAPSVDPLWQAECGSCHLAYSPGLLPARSWDRLLSTLDRHFGDDASVSPETRVRLAAIAGAGAADRSSAPLSRAITRSAAGITPERLFDVPVLAHEHDEDGVFRRAGAPRPSACAACHPQAAAGRFSESEIRLPPSPSPSPNR